MSRHNKTVISIRVTEEQNEAFERLAELTEKVTGVPTTKTWVVLRTSHLGIGKFMKQLGIDTGNSVSKTIARTKKYKRKKV